MRDRDRIWDAQPRVEYAPPRRRSLADQRHRYFRDATVASLAGYVVVFATLTWMMR